MNWFKKSVNLVEGNNFGFEESGTWKNDSSTFVFNTNYHASAKVLLKCCTQLNLYPIHTN